MQQRHATGTTAGLFFAASPFALSEGSRTIFELPFVLMEVDQNNLLRLNTRRDGAVDTTPLQVVPGVNYPMSLELSDGLLQGSATAPLGWFESYDPGQVFFLGALAGIEDALVLVTESQVFMLKSGETRFTQTTLESPVSEVRIWERDGEQQMGICEPERNRILIGQTEINIIGRLSWPFGGTAVLGFGTGSLGSEDGDFVMPLSFDQSPDGRVYVLDAGNHRIQAFDADGDYLTQWGGEFQFGSGSDPSDFSGSIIVDDEGFIYVADVGNKRVQKFAP